VSELEQQVRRYLEELEHERNITIYEIESAPDTETMFRLSGRLRKIEDVITRLDDILRGGIHC
jgi:SOS response regulatory protein OraA/RecX